MDTFWSHFWLGVCIWQLYREVKLRDELRNAKDQLRWQTERKHE